MIVQGILHLTQPRPTCLLPLSAPRTRLEIGKSLSNPTVTSQVSIRYSILDFAFTSLSWPSISLLPSFRPASSSSFGPKCCCAFPHPDCWVPVTRRRVFAKSYGRPDPELIPNVIAVASEKPTFSTTCLLPFLSPT